jgi:hypothetical protein
MLVGVLWKAAGRVDCGVCARTCFAHFGGKLILGVLFGPLGVVLIPLCITLAEWVGVFVVKGVESGIVRTKAGVVETGV